MPRGSFHKAQRGPHAKPLVVRNVAMKWIFPCFVGATELTSSFRVGFSVTHDWRANFQRIIFFVENSLDFTWQGKRTGPAVQSWCGVLSGKQTTEVGKEKHASPSSRTRCFMYLILVCDRLLITAGGKDQQIEDIESVATLLKA